MKPSKKDFVDEAEAIIERISSEVMELSDTAQPDILNSIFRGVHTLKGLSGLFRLEHLTDLCHALESLLDDLRLGEIAVKQDTSDVILANIDIIRGQVIKVSKDEDVDELSDAIGEIEAFRKSSRTDEVDSYRDSGISRTILKVLSQYEESRLKSNLKDGKDIYTINAVFSLEDFAPKLKKLNAKLKEFGEIIATLPSSENIPNSSIGFRLFYGSTLTLDNLKEKISIEDIKHLMEVKATRPVKSSAVVKSADYGATGATQTVRVDIDKLDKILNTVNELIMAKGALSRITDELTESLDHMALTTDMHNVSCALDKNLRILQGQILELRMVPFSQIFAKLAQVVQRYTREVKKNINLKLFGEDAEIDKQIADVIIEPLIHLIRNSIDHGIELADERNAIGKNEHGTITMRAYSKGNDIVIEVQDDGAGLDKDKILRKAIEKGLVNEDNSLNERDIYNLIFLPGLSTRDTVSQLSGRGMGMDIVRDRIGSLGGLLGIVTEKNVGTTFILTMPITSAILKALIIQVADTIFAIPLTSISESFLIETKKIQTIEGREIIELRDEILPILRLATFFELEEVQKDYFYVVVVGIGNRRMGLLVDSLLEQRDIIIKSLGDRLKKIPGISAAAEIGRHKIVYVIDIAAMQELPLSPASKQKDPPDSVSDASQASTLIENDEAEGVVPEEHPDKATASEEPMTMLPGEDAQPSSEIELIAFTVSNEEFAIRMSEMGEIIKSHLISSVPRSPSYLMGATFYRGRIMPVISLQDRLSLRKGKVGKQKIIVMLTSKEPVGIYADRIIDVIKIPEKEILPLPSTLSDREKSFIEGVIKMGERFISVLRINNIAQIEAKQAKRTYPE